MGAVKVIILTCQECDSEFEYHSTTGGKPKHCEECKAAMATKRRHEQAGSAIRSMVRDGVYVETPNGLIGIVISRDSSASEVTIKLETGVIARYKTRRGPCES